mmetsp:Transcript_2032/g.2493  ORF Transcript_2032/g.2493 Transcript_2032/m.2493 type:complete len:80 (-) Transcript_2032:137-376(-)
MISHANILQPSVFTAFSSPLQKIGINGTKYAFFCFSPSLDLIVIKYIFSSANSTCPYYSIRGYQSHSMAIPLIGIFVER